jgi:hypothetical protein
MNQQISMCLNIRWKTRCIQTCSFTRHTLLLRPASRKNRSKIINGVSGPLPSFLPVVECDGPPPERKARPPRMTRLSRALSLALSRASPSRSMIPPDGKKAVSTSRRVTTSTTDEAVTEEVELARERGCVDVTGFESKRGSKGGRAESVAVVR